MAKKELSPKQVADLFFKSEELRWIVWDGKIDYDVVMQAIQKLIDESKAKGGNNAQVAGVN